MIQIKDRVKMGSWIHQRLEKDKVNTGEVGICQSLQRSRLESSPKHVIIDVIITRNFQNECGK
jgi:hypothetical protein